MYAPAQVIVLEPEHRRIAHIRMLGQDRLHLSRHHVGAAGDDLVQAPGGQEQVTVRIDVADVAPLQLVYFLCADALDPARVFSWQRIDFGTSDVVTLKTTKSGILNEKLKADDSVDVLTARLNFKF
jgi:hypothetical protein